MTSKVILNLSNDDDDDGGDWIVVSKKRKKQRQKSSSNEKLVREKVVLTQQQYDKLDTISKVIYDILSNHPYLIPASYITKQVNSRLVSTYTKKDIGKLLYNGPLTPFLFRYAKKTPTLWGIRYVDTLCVMV